MISRFLCWEQLKRVLEVCVDSTLIVICTINPLKNMICFTHFCVFCVQGLCHTFVHYSQSCVGGAVVGVSLCFQTSASHEVLAQLSIHFPFCRISCPQLKPAFCSERPM